MSKSAAVSISLTVALSVLFVLAVQFSVAAPIAAPLAGEVTVCTWLGCKPGAVSYTQDDGKLSCAQDLEIEGFRGTFFYDGLLDQTWFVTITAAGHEVGSHLADHLKNGQMPHPACEPTCTLTSLRQTPYTQTVVDDFRKDQIDPNVSLIEAATGQPVLSMAYPYGSTDANRMAASEFYFLGARGYYNPYDGAEFPWVTYTNAAVLPDAMLINSDDGSHDVELIDTAISQGRWAIFTMHDTCNSLGYIVEKRADLWVAPVGEVLKYIKVRDAFRFDNYLKTYNTISFDAGHSLSTMLRETYTHTALLPITFNNSVTLKVDLPLDTGAGTVTVDGVPVSTTIMGSISGLHSVLVTATLGITRHVEIALTDPNAIQLYAITARSATAPGENWGWLFAMIAMGVGGFAGLMKANRRPTRPQ